MKNKVETTCKSEDDTNYPRIGGITATICKFLVSACLLIFSIIVGATRPWMLRTQ